MKTNSLAQAATLLPLAIGLTMSGMGSTPRSSARTSTQPASCSRFEIDSTASSPLSAVILPPSRICSTRTSNGFELPDPACTPGALNPTITQDVLEDPAFRTACVRGQASSSADKNKTYQWYDIEHPEQNTGQNQTCELDHLISLELGGADTVDNIWPQCGPPGVALSERYFKRKDAVENFLAKQVRDGKMPLAEAQKGIAADWTQYLAAAEGCDGTPCE